MNGLYDEVKIALHAMWQRRWLALAVAWAIALIGWLVIALIPNSYESLSRVSVASQAILSETAGVSEGERQADMDRVRTTLTSAENLARVVRGTDLAQAATTDVELANQIGMLGEAVTVKALPDNIFEISARIGGGGRSDAANALLARQVVTQLVGIFTSENIAGDRGATAETLAFLNGELARRETQLAQAEDRRAAFEQRYMGLLPGSGSIEQRMEAARSELSQVSGDLAAAQSALGAMNGQMASTPATVAGVGPGGAPGGARGRLAALQAQLSDYAGRGLTDQHPDVIATRAQIARLAPEAAREGTGGGAGSSPNPLYASLRTMQAERQASVASLVSRRSQLMSDMAQYAAKQSAEPGVAAEQARLTRDHDALKAQYDKLLADREAVQLRADIGSKTAAVKVQMIDPPSAPQVPVAPKRPLLLFGVLILAIGAGAGAAFAKGQLTTTYPTAARLAAATGMPVLGAVSEVVTTAEAERRHVHLMRFAGAAGGLVACFLLLMTIEFVQRGLVA